MDEASVKISHYRWAGQWGPFKIKIPCGECGLTKSIIKDVVEHELSDIPIEIEEHEWLSEWWKPLFHGGWHAPIVMVEDKVINQGTALNKGLLIQAVVEAYAMKTEIEGNHLFGKDTCPFCQKAKKILDEKGIEFTYHEVVKNPKDLYEMIARVKPIIGPKKTLTVPQIWLDGKYIGGCDDLEKHFGMN